MCWKRDVDKLDVLYYKIEVFGLLFYLNLIILSIFIWFGLVVEMFYKNKSKIYSEFLYIVFFNGYVILDFNFVVVISNYNGLVGV